MIKNRVEIYTSKSCNPCKMLKVYLEREDIDFSRIVFKDITEHSDDVVRYDILRVPTVLLIEQDEDDVENNKIVYVKLNDTVPILIKDIKNHLEV